MGRFGRDLKTVSWLDCAGRLTLYGKFEAAFQDVGGFDPRMRVSPTRHPGLRSQKNFSREQMLAFVAEKGCENGGTPTVTDGRST